MLFECPAKAAVTETVDVVDLRIFSQVTVCTVGKSDQVIGFDSFKSCWSPENLLRSGTQAVDGTVVSRWQSCYRYIYVKLPEL